MKKREREVTGFGQFEHTRQKEAGSGVTLFGVECNARDTMEHASWDVVDKNEGNMAEEIGRKQVHEGVWLMESSVWAHVIKRTGQPKATERRR